MKTAVRILSTKKLLHNQKQFLLNAEFAVVEADFIGIVHKDFELTDISDNLIFTSTNSVKSFLRNPGSSRFKGSNIFCVGSKTKTVIEQNGYTVSAHADYAKELADLIIEQYKGQRFTFFSGSLRRDTLPEALTNAGVVFNEIEVYETVLTPHKINAVQDGILFFSPSGVESYLKMNTVKDATCFCIGTTTAKALKGITNKVVVANKPTVENVIIQTINYYKNYTTDIS